MNKRIEILDTPIDAITMRETLDIIEDSIRNKMQIQHVVVNSAKIVNMKKDASLYNSVVNSDIINADGQSVVWASRILKRPLPERVTGIDLMENLVAMAHEKKYKIFFFGAKEEVVRAVVDLYSNKYSKNIIAGFRNGYFRDEEEKSIAEMIRDSKADILFVAIPSPKKEIYINKYKKIINVPFVMGVGGSFDVVSGKIPRAPKWMQTCGLEWLFRLLQEPRKMWKRYLITNSLFIYYLFKEKYIRNKS